MCTRALTRAIVRVLKAEHLSIMGLHYMHLTHGANVVHPDVAGEVTRGKMAAIGRHADTLDPIPGLVEVRLAGVILVLAEGAQTRVRVYDV